MNDGISRESPGAIVLDLTEKVGGWTYFLAVQRGLALVLPLVTVGALALLLKEFPIPAVRDLLDVGLGRHWRAVCENLVTGSFGIASLAVLIAFSGTLASLRNQRHKGQFVSPIMAAVVVLSCFFVIAAPADGSDWTAALSMNKGLFVALCVAAVSCWLFLRLAQINALQLPLRIVGNDPVIRDILTVMPAAMATLVVFGVVRAILSAQGVDQIHAIASGLLAAPFSGAKDGIGFALGYSMLTQVLWFFGAHGPNLLFPVEETILVPASLANSAAIAAGDAPVHIFTKPFFDAFTRMGGSGSTLCLIIAILAGSRDGGVRRLCLFALIPALCNVNEPLLFGIPLVLNPIYLIPFLAAPVIQTLAAYGATILDLLPRTVSEAGWTTPALVSGWVATGTPAGTVMQVVNLLIGTAIYFPFVRLADRLRERQGARVMDALLRTAEGVGHGVRKRKCLDQPGEIGRLAKALAADLMDGLATEGQLFLEYQPQIDAEGNRVHGVEALLRWHHPAYGRIPPPITVSLAEDMDCIDRLGLFVLKKACAQRMLWEGHVPDDLVISVNVSPRQLLDPAFDRKVMDCLEETGLEPGLLELEITESMVVEPDAPTGSLLRRLREHGVRVAIDDFGMGHASLRYLREFPVDTVKIDRSLTAISPGNVNEHIVRSIVDLGQALGIMTVVEGVEAPSQLSRFLNLGCRTFQGFLFSRPVSGEDFLKFVENGSAGWNSFDDPARTEKKP